MKVAIFGASGGIGKHAVQHALKKGYEVNAVVRNPVRFTITHENLTLIEGEINDSTIVKEAINGCDAVIWCVGIPMKKYEETPSLDGHKILLKTMHELGITRLIDWATPSVHRLTKKRHKSMVLKLRLCMAICGLKHCKGLS